MSVSKSTTVDQITTQLVQILDLAISQVQTAHPGEGLPSSTLKVSVFDQDQKEHPFILKRQDNDVAYRLYQQYLKPYCLNSPKEYGYIELDGQLLLVMDYVKHLPVNWADNNGHLRAVEWLVKKDQITWQNIDTIRNLDCLGKLEYYGLDYWLPIFEKWYIDSTSNNQAKEVWRRVIANQNRINEYIDELSQAGIQTVVHGDLSVDNILFVQDEGNNDLLVIDWTQPHIASVTKDLAALYDNAPDNVKNDIIETYRKHIDFPHFDEIFSKAKVLRCIGYLSWMAWMINIGQKEEIAQTELDQVATRLIMSLD